MKASSTKLRQGNSFKQSAVMKSQGLVVLGMHRSGTSAVTRVLNLLGCALPDDLLGAGDGNESGHWESRAAVALNDSILASAGSSWEDWGPINSDWNESGIRSSMIEQVVEVVNTHAALGLLFALKDPRMCRLADLWLEGMDVAGVEPLVIIMLRNPAEVIASLESRDLMAPAYGQLLWLRHALDAEYFSRGRRRVVCRYDQLLRNWPGMISRVKSALGVSLPRNSPAVHAEIDGFLSRQLRHHEQDPALATDNLDMPDWLRRAYAILFDWSENGERGSDHAELDRIRQEFNNAYAAFSRVLLAAGISGQVGSGGQLRRELSNQLEAARLAEETARLAMQEVEEKQAATSAREAELLLRLESGNSRMEEVQRELDAASAHVEQNRAQLESANDRAAQAQAELEAVNARMEQAQAELNDGNARAEQALAELEVLKSQLTQAELVVKEAERLRIGELELQQEKSSLQAAVQALQAEVDQAREQRSLIEQQLESAIAEAQEQALQVAELTGRANSAESSLVQRQEELSQYLDKLLTLERSASASEVLATQEQERRLASEKRTADAEAKLADSKARLEKARNAPPPPHLISEIAQLTTLLAQQESLAQVAKAAASKAEAQAEQETERRKESERVIAETEAKLADLQARLDQQKVSTEAAEAARATTERKLAARFDEIARITAMLAEESGRASASSADADWLRSMAELAGRFPKWWALMPRAWRRPREHAHYQRAGLFDARAYLDIYPDVVADGMDPVRHYIHHGMGEGRKRPQ